MSDHETSLSSGTAANGSRLFILLAGVAILGAVFGIVWMQSAKYEPLVVGKPAPDFSLSDLNDKPYRLSDFRGKVVFLNFWATWCTPCRAEMHDIDSTYRAHRPQGLEVLAIDLTDEDRLKDVRRFVNELALSFPILLDEEGKVWRRYAARGLPTSVFIDTAGVVRLVVPGPVGSERLQQGLVEILPTR